MKHYPKQAGLALVLVAGLGWLAGPARASLVAQYDSANYTAGTWTDTSGSGDNATQSTPANQPTLVPNATPGGKSALLFTKASNQYLNLTTSVGLSDTYSFVFVGNPLFAYPRNAQGGVIGGGAASAPNYDIRGFGYDNGQLIYDNGFALAPGLTLNTGSGWKVFAVTDDGTTVRFYTNGVLQTSYTGAIAANGGTLLYVGNSGSGGAFDGSIAALQAYNTTLSPTAIQTLSGQLFTEYMVPEPSALLLLALGGALAWRFAKRCGA